jgi:pyrroloquinoline quinone biosynthesis protein D
MADALTPDDVVRLAPHALLRFDAMRQSWLLLGPERVFSPSDTAVAILQACDGASIGAVAARLAQMFNAPAEVILKDALMVLESLAAKGYLTRDKGYLTRGERA